MSLNSKKRKERKRKVKKKKKEKKKLPQEKQTVFASKEAFARSKHWCSASVVIGYFALTYEGLFVAYSVCFIYHSKK